MLTSSPAKKSPPFASFSYSWIVALFAVTLGSWLGLLASAQVLLPSQIEVIGAARKELALGIVTAAGASAAVVSAPLMGVLSDRTRWRFGRRRSWIIGGSAVCAVALLALPLQSSLLGVGLCWAFVHGGTGGVHAVVCAVVADRVAVNRRGTVFAVVDLAQPVGLVAGTLLVSSLSIEDAYPLVAGLAVLLAVPYAFIGRDVPAPARAERRQRRLPDPGSLGPEFAWAWAGRFAAQLATSLATVYLLYFLRDEIRIGDPAEGVAVLSLLFTSGIVLVGLLIGRLSDRLERRRIFVVAAALLMAVALTGMASVPTWTVAVVAATALGAGYGAHLAVGQALVTQLLRNDEDRGRDLGTMNMAGSSAVVVAPIVAIASVGLGGYTLLFLLAAVMAVVSGLLVKPIRSVR
ncbi:MFS transporter [Actinomadura welshii]|uniref:MFS transporter n=1 Tax=Actinomadura welshii TaxID=3103817 RepID=UPI000409414C|nr:MFS transporter [Actinomadura madurae]